MSFNRIRKTTATPSFLSMDGVLSPSNPYMMRGVPKFDKLEDGAYKIVVILDESGSMDSVCEDIIKAVNNLIIEQRGLRDTDSAPALFTLVKFNTEVTTVKLNTPFRSAELLNDRDYSPNGSTALYDAIGEAIDAYRREKNVLMVIVTDGAENSSNKYNKQMVAKAIDTFKADTSLGWSFVYIGCDMDTMRQGNDLGLNMGNNVATLQTAGRDKFIGCMSKVSNAVQSQRNKTSGSAAYGYSDMTQCLNSTPEAKASQTKTKPADVYGAGL